MYRLACRRIAREVPVSSSGWLGTVRTCLSAFCLSAFDVIRMSFTWLPFREAMEKPNPWSMETTLLPLSRLSLGTQRPHLVAH